MKKIDIFCIILSFLIALGIIFLFSYEPMMTADDTVKIGIVSLESNSHTSNLKGLKNIDSKKINKNIDKIEKIEKEEKEKRTEKIQEPKKELKPKPSLADLKKALSSSKPKLKNSISNKESFNPEKENSEDLDRILGTVEDGEGLISGNKMGTIDGKILVKWNSNNRKPKFPEIAEYSGKNGTVKIMLKVDNYGNVINYVIEKGSGVPEIDEAIEKVIGTWKINLLKSKKEIGGTFFINYNFSLR